MSLYIPKIANTARLKGITGSVAEREKVCEKLFAKFSTFLEDTFEKNSKWGAEYISRFELNDFFKKTIPNINVRIIDYNKGNSSANGMLENIVAKNYFNIIGYRLKVPFTMHNSIIYKKDFEKIGTLSHEVKHLFKQITEPKYPIQVIQNLPALLDDKQYNFYKRVLYKNEIEELTIIDKDALNLKLRKFADRVFLLKSVKN